MVLAISLVIVLIVILFIIIIPTLYGFLIGAPIYYSPAKATEEALIAVAAKPGEKFCDLGTGNGRAMIIAAKKFNLAVSGFELSPPLFWLTKANLFLHGIKNFELHLKNFYNQDLSEADIIFCFLTPAAMKKLQPKFEKELKAGTRIISYAFRIPDWQGHAALHPDTPGKVHIYIKQ